jgi:hypothetical protein
VKAYKTKRCKACGNQFQPTKGFQKACSPSCAFNYSRTERIRKEKQEAAKRLREGRAKLKTKSEHLKDAQGQFNRFIRMRDLTANEPCISCQRHHEGKYNAGHFRTVASAPELRFTENQVNLQCEPCNSHLSGNITAYRIHLIKKIGLEAVEEIEGHHDPLKLTIDDIKIIKDKYRLKANELAKELDSYSR